MRIVGTIAALFSLAGFASADHCRARVVQQAYVAPYVAPVAIATYVPVAVAVPQYSTGYSAEGDTALALREIAAELKALRESLAGGAGPATKPTEPDNSVTARVNAIGVAKCAKCHNETNHKDKGGGHLLLTDAGAFVDGLDWESLRDEIESGRMPRGGPELSDDDYRVFVEKQREQLKIKKAQKKAESGT